MMEKVNYFNLHFANYRWVKIYFQCFRPLLLLSWKLSSNILTHFSIRKLLFCPFSGLFFSSYKTSQWLQKIIHKTRNFKSTTIERIQKVSWDKGKGKNRKFRLTSEFSTAIWHVVYYIIYYLAKLPAKCGHSIKHFQSCRLKGVGNCIWNCRWKHPWREIFQEKDEYILKEMR